MAQSIGDLFITLGFKVDNQPLKDFDNSIQSVFSGLLKFSALAGTGAGLYEITKGVAETTNQWRNFNSEVGGSTNALQKFIALYSTVNPFSSLAQAQTVATNVQQYGSNAFYGGDGSAYGRFGGNPSDFINPATGQIDTTLILPKVIERLRNGRDLALSQAGGNVAQVNKWITEITGSPDTINMLNATPEQQSKAEHALDLIKQQIDETEAATEKVSELKIGWDNFVNHVVVSLAAGANYIANPGEKPKNFNDYLTKKGWGGIIGDALIDGSKTMLGGAENLAALTSIGFKNIFGGVGSSDALTHAFLVSNGLAPSGSSIVNKTTVIGNTLGSRSHNPGNLQPDGVETQYTDDASGLSAMAALLKKYGINGWDSIDSIVNHWAPASGKGNSEASASAYKAALMKALGISENQHLNLNDPATLERLMPAMIKQEGNGSFTAQQIAQAAGDTNNAVTINVQSNSDDNEDLARRIHQRFIDVTYPTQNLGGY